MKTGSATARLPEQQAAANRLLNIREVAARLGVCSRQVQKLVIAGRFIPPLRLSRSVRWREADVTRFLDCGCDMAKYNAQIANGAT